MTAISHCSTKLNLVSASCSEKNLELTGLQGVSDQSFGIHVAELANFPENVVKVCCSAYLSESKESQFLLACETQG